MAARAVSDSKSPQSREFVAGPDDTTQGKFDRALAFHQNGDFASAKVLYEEILNSSPDHVGALHLSGLIFIEENRADLAQGFLTRAITLAPDFAPLHSSYGVALSERGRFEEALTSYDKVIAIAPLDGEAFYNRGHALRSLGRFCEAVADYEQVLTLQPWNAQASSNQGDALQSLGQLEEALVCYAKAIGVEPDFAEAYSNRGWALHEMRRFDEALLSYNQAVAINPHLSAAWFNRGNTLKDVRRFADAAASYAQAIMIEPQNAQAWSNKGDALQSLGRFAEALHLYDRALAIRADYADGWSNRGVCLKALGRMQDAISSFDKAIGCTDDHHEAHWNKALTLLLMERFEEGWPLYEWRKRARDPAGRWICDQPAWLGKEDISNKTLLVHSEQGLGDTIQFSRYLRCLNDLGAKILFAPQKPLQVLMGTLDATFEIVDDDQTHVQFDYHVPLMSLPLAFQTDLSNSPRRTTYLGVEEARIESWKKIIGPDGFKIGICWQGNMGDMDLGRSFPVRQFLPLGLIPGLRLISLQKGHGESQLMHVPAGMMVETLGADFDAGPDAFVDTAAVMKCCDLVITSDTAVAHLAGALGVKTWVALKQVPDWRWFLERDDSPWYPSMRLFRQGSPGDWDGVFASMKVALVEAMASVRESGSAP